MCHSHQIGYALAKARIEDMQRAAAACAPRGRGRWTRPAAACRGAARPDPHAGDAHASGEKAVMYHHSSSEGA